jgi:membrane protein YqaA with SNARE-associated domain
LNLAILFANIPWARIGGWLRHAEIGLIALLKPLGVWGLCGMAIVDSSSLPLPFLDPLVVSYGAANPRSFLLYCFMAALGSAIGSMVPYYLGRAGGELFLLKRINRRRYERLRDRFENQEFLAIMLPAMMPPPMPVKLFELAAGVFEMRPAWYFLAICTGKFIRFAVESIVVIVYGPAILETAMHALHRHLNLVLGGVGALVLAIAVWVIRKIFDRRRGIALPVEEDEEEGLG